VGAEDEGHTQRIAVVERFDREDVDDAEGGGVDADAKSERHHGGRGEAGCASHHAQSVHQVLHERLHDAISPARLPRCRRHAGLVTKLVDAACGDGRHRDAPPSPASDAAAVPDLLEITGDGFAARRRQKTPQLHGVPNLGLRPRAISAIWPCASAMAAAPVAVNR